MPGGGLVRVGGLAAVGGGALLVAHGAVMVLADANLDAPPHALPPIALGLVGLGAGLRGGGGRPARVGRLLASAALAVSLVQLVALALMHRREEPFWSVHGLGLAGSLLLVLIAAPLLGVAALHAGTFRAGWRIVPLAVGLLWLPLLLVGEWAGDRLSPARELSLGFVPAGLAWILLGAALVLGTTAEPARAATPGPSSPPPRLW